MVCLVRCVINDIYFCLQDKPHKCSLCSKSFPTPGDLRSHMYVHSGSWPFKCHICSRGFSKHTNLKNHLFLHTGKLKFFGNCKKEVANFAWKAVISGWMIIRSGCGVRQALGLITEYTNVLDAIFTSCKICLPFDKVCS